MLTLELLGEWSHAWNLSWGYNSHLVMAQVHAAFLNWVQIHMQGVNWDWRWTFKLAGLYVNQKEPLWKQWASKEHAKLFTIHSW